MPSSFTGVPGKITSVWGQFVPGAGPGGSPTPGAATGGSGQTIIGGPPIPGAPWLRRLVAPPPDNRPAPISPQVLTPPPVVGGPPIIGAPWNHFRIFHQPALVLPVIPPPPVIPAPPSVQGGPPILGAPWRRRMPTQDVNLNVAPSPPPPQVQPPSVVGGPPVLGAPWNRRAIVEQFTPIGPAPAPLSPVGPTPQVSGGPVLFAPWQAGRVIPVQPVPGPTPSSPPPQIVGVVPPVSRVPSDDRRLARFTEVVADILNALVARGELVREGPADWSLGDVLLSFNGRTGDIIFQVSDLPLSGATPGNYQFPTLTVDQYGRITAVNSANGSQGVPLIGGGPNPAVFGTRLVQIDSRVGIIQNDGSSGSGTVTFDISVADRHLLTLTGIPTLALANVGNVPIFTIILQQDGTGGRTVSWFSTIRWMGGSPPVLTTTAGKYDAFTFINLGTGTYLGFVAGQNA